jgi:CHASE2 domain-containing sensor protein
VIGGFGSRATSAIAVVLAVCLGVRVAAWLIGPLLPILIGVGVVYAVALGLLRRR